MSRKAKEKTRCSNLSFEDCELAILRQAVDKAEHKMVKRVVSSESIIRIIEIVEQFIQRKKLICYGGTAINNILPASDQFYDKDVEIPDYDFMSSHALEDAKELADIYVRNQFTEVEAKSGMHMGTYKVYVNFIPIADITQMPDGIFKALTHDAIRVKGILYCPPNYLRMSMYLELSRPAGDISRWEKVAKRLALLNKHFPVTTNHCKTIEYQRPMALKKGEDVIYSTLRKTLVSQDVVFFGGYAISLYSHYMPKPLRVKIQQFPDFDVLSNHPEETAEIVKERLSDVGIRDIKIIAHPPIGDVIPEHIEIKINKETVLFIYKPIACHSYNVIKIEGEAVRIATIDTMLSFYLAFLYANKPYYNAYLERIQCMAKFLFDVQQKNRLSQKGLLKRFSITCYGHQESIEEIRAHKAEMYRKIKDSKNDAQLEAMFLSYKPKLSAIKNGTTKKRETNANKKRETTKKRGIKKRGTKKHGWFF